MVDQPSNKADVMHFAVDLVEASNAEGRIRSRPTLRGKYGELSLTEKAQVRDLLDFNMRQSIKDGDFRKARAWLMCLDVVSGRV